MKDLIGSKNIMKQNASIVLVNANNIRVLTENSTELEDRVKPLRDYRSELTCPG